MNRYDELTDRQKELADRIINSMASHRYGSIDMTRTRNPDKTDQEVLTVRMGPWEGSPDVAPANR